MALDLQQNPYYDDFDSSKNYHRILFRPSYAVQARELTQLQTILQNQINEFGKNIFKDGSIVTGGQTLLETTGVFYVAIEPVDPDGVAIDLDNFIGEYIVDGDGNGVRAYVIAGQEETDSTPTVLVVKYVSGQRFDITSTTPITTADGTYSASLLVDPTQFTGITSTLGNSSIVSVQTGVFFIRGYFVQVDEQTIILDAFDNTPSYRVGLELEDSIVDAAEDASLLDPAQDASNYQAPGANRYKVALTLAKRSLTSTDDTAFIELLRVENGTLTKKIQYPTYSVLEDTLARRTNDQSGSFTVRPFKIALTPHTTYANAYNIIAEPGKAYVLGYEFETIAPTTIKAERARNVANVYNYNLTIDYQNYVDVTKLVGPIPFTTLEAATVHCVNTASITTANSAAAGATRIGTLRVRALDYQSGANSTSISTGIWRAYTFAANIGSSTVANSSATGSANTIYLGAGSSPVTNAYVGVKITVTTNAGATINETKNIGRYDGPNNLAYLAGTETWDFGVPGTMTQLRLDYEFKDAESFVYANTTTNYHTFATTMDISSDSKYSVSEDPYQGAFISDTNFNRMLLQLPYPWIADQSVVGGTPLTNTEYWGRKIYTGQSFTTNVITITSVSGITSAVNGSPLSGTDAIDNVLVIIRGNTGTTIANNQVINFTSGSNTVTVSTASNTSTWTITVPDAGSAATADVYVKVKLPYAHTIGSVLRTKSSRIANTANVTNTGGTRIADSSGLVQWYSQASGANGAQVTFYANSAAWLILRQPGVSQSLYTSDGTALRKVYDFGANTPSQANVAYASDITSRYSFDSGQNDNAYDHASIVLKPTSSGPVGNVAVLLDYFAHSGLGYLTVDSYISGNVSYGNIPSYTSATTGQVYQLRDCVDFRPRRQDADWLGKYDEELFGTSGLSFETDFSYYLARIDKVILTKDRTFEVIEGVPSLFPVPPADKDNAMTLYTLVLPPYTANTAEIRQRYVDNRRYTMKDIGALEKRITNLEYYTSLNLLEQAAKNQEITDDTGANRFKNGIMVDPFTGHSIGDVVNDDYHCSIDSQNQELRPPFSVQNLLLSFNESNSTNYARRGAVVSMNWTANTLVDQPYASQAINVNPFNTVAFIGQIQLDPTSDTWVDTNQAPDVHVNLEGDNDAWAALAQVVTTANPGKIFGTTWNSWQTTWTGVSDRGTQEITPTWQGWLGGLGHFVPVFGNIISRNITDITQKQVRTGLRTSFVPATITQSIGNKVVDVSIVPYIRSRGVLFIGKMFAPNTNLYAFFDGTNVTSYCNRPNIVKVANGSISYIDTYQNGESVRVFDPARGANTARGLVVLSRNEDGYTNVSVVNVTGGDDSNIANSYVVHSTNSTFLIGATSGTNTRISGYYHNSGFVTNPNVSSILLAHDVANSNVGISNTTIVGQTIYFTSANGLGQSATITSYDYLTRNVAFSPSLTTTPNTSTTYSIGQFKTDKRGEIAGVFIIPSTANVRFRTGERSFTLVDSLNGIVDGSGTNGSVKYVAQGLLQTQDNTLISTRVPTIQRTVLGEERTIQSTVVTDTVIGQQQIGYWDPLAQTFLVDQRVHPSGVQITAVRLLFKSKDPNIPLQFQLRPVVNGFPHSSQVIPGTDVVINPSDIIEVSEATLAARNANTTTFNNPFDDSDLYTEITFHGPVYLPQGAEYAIVLMANSQKYEVYISNLGSKVLGTDRLISSQPYLGVLFKSQNSTTWNPIQEQDLAFRLEYAKYDPSLTANLEFILSSSNSISANVPLDVFYITSGNLLLPNTAIETLYATTTNTGVNENFKTFQLDQNVFFDDTLGRRVATSTTSSFKVRFLLTTENADISPIVDLDRVSLLAIENIVNNLGLNTNSLIVTTSSSTWKQTTNIANISVAITGGGGTGANAYIANTNIDTNNNILANITVDVAGSGYTTSPTVTFSGHDSANTGRSATIVVVGEDYPAGGPSNARYITRKVTLADGMDAGDFRVYFAAIKPAEARIYIYYKILSADDSDVFDNKNYQLMTCIGGVNNLSLNQNDWKDFVYAPGSGNIADDRVQYGTFTSFKHFAIKVVMASSDTTKVPRIRDFRVIATPSLS